MEKRPVGSTWGDWGEEDQLGRLNLVGPEQVKNAISQVEHGITFTLSLPLNLPGGTILNPARKPPEIRPAKRHGAPYFNFELSSVDNRLDDVACDDYFTLYSQYSTQWDSLAHRGSKFDTKGDGTREIVFYNGYRADYDVVINKDGTTSANRLGIDNLAKHGVQGQGVIVDLHSKCGVFPQVKVGYEKLMAIFEEQNIQIETGDILCLWTGLDHEIIQSQGKPDTSIRKACAVLDGKDERLLRWIRKTNISAIVSDNLAIEAMGESIESCRSNLPLHELCLFKLGLPLGELWHLAELAKWMRSNKRSKPLLTAPLYSFLEQLVRQ